MAPRRGIDRSDPRGLRPGRERMQRAENIFEPREKNRRPPQRPVRAPRPRASIPGAQPGRRLRQLERLRCSAVWRAASAARRRSAPARGSKSLRSRCRGGNLTLSPRPTAVAADRWCGTASYPARCARRPARGGGDSAFERQPAGASAAKYGAVGSCACDGKVAALRSSLRVSCWPRRPAFLRGRAGREAVIPGEGRWPRWFRSGGPGAGMAGGDFPAGGLRGGDCGAGAVRSTWSSVRSPPFEFNQAQLATGGDGVEAGQGFVAAAEFLVLLPQCLLGSFARADFFHHNAVVRVLRGPVRQPGFGGAARRSAAAAAEGGAGVGSGFMGPARAARVARADGFRGV